jgi:hypothetical protein
MLLTFDQLKNIVTNYMASNKISAANFDPTSNNTAGLIDKIAKIVMLDTTYADKLTMFDGEDLTLGKIVEEYNEDLVAPVDFDPTGAGALTPHDPSYRPNFYSYSLGEKTFATTRRMNDFERAANSTPELAELIAKITKKLYDSFASWKYASKRELLNKLATACESEQFASSVYAAGTAYSVVGAVLKESAGSDVRGIVYKKITIADSTSWADLVNNGFIVPLDLVSKIAVPTDEATGEAWIAQLKKDAEIANDLNLGHSLNGNSLGVGDAGYVLIVKQGIMPEIETKVIAGAFQKDAIAMPAEVVRVPDFGSNATGVYAMLVDRRIARLHNDYRDVLSQLNAEGHFINYFMHTENTAFFSRNLFVKVYEAA